MSSLKAKQPTLISSIIRNATVYSSKDVSVLNKVAYASNPSILGGCSKSTPNLSPIWANQSVTETCVKTKNYKGLEM